MKPFAGDRPFVRLAAFLFALCATAVTANAATKHYTHADDHRTVPPTTNSVEGGVTGLNGAFIQAEYAVYAGAAQTERGRQRAVREAAQGRYAFDEALTYLEQSPRAANVIKRIANADGLMLVVINHDCRDGQSMGLGWKSIVYWDPACASRIARGTNSPSLILLHEMVHTLHLFEDPEAYMNGGSQKNKQFDDNEERRTILYGEAPVARQLGEVVRTNHIDGTPFIVNDPTLR